MDNFEYVITNMVSAIANEQQPTLPYPTKHPTSDKVVISVCTFGMPNHRPIFSSLVHLMENIYSMKTSNTACTVRDLYYQYVKYFQDQQIVEVVLTKICFMATVGRFDLPIQPSAKGLIAGNLTWSGESGVRVHLDEISPKGMLITSMLLSLDDMQTTAPFILFVEKDAVFQTLLQMDAFHTFQVGHFIMITGKGYTDRLTRRVLNHLSTKLKLPVFALVDADAYGIDILANIKWGSCSHDRLRLNRDLYKNLKFHQETLPDLYWIGFLPTHVHSLAKPKDCVPLNDTDKRRFKLLLQRSRMNGEAKWAEEIKFALKHNIKAEIEALGDFLPQYLRNRIRELL